MVLSKDDVAHIARLAKLRFSDDELDMFSSQLSAILDFVRQLDELDTEGVQPTAQVTGLTNIMRKDEIEMAENEEALLECAPHQVQNRSLKIPKMM